MAKRLVVKMQMTIELEDTSNGEHDASNARCVYCGWSRAYKSPESARRGLAAHLPHCPEKEGSEEKANGIILKWFKELTGDE
jgi:hypothetical protein